MFKSKSVKITLIAIVAILLALVLFQTKKDFKIEVGFYRTTCEYAEFTGCLIVNENPFMGVIAGLDYESGYRYVIRVKG
jgi:hypothetical protein